MSSTYLYLSGDHREVSQMLPAIRRRATERGYELKWITPLNDGTDHIPEIQKAIEKSSGVIYLIGNRYGPEPLEVEPIFGRCSYTQYEFFYARYMGKPWAAYLLADGESFPKEADIFSQLQRDYRRVFATLKSGTDHFDREIDQLCDVADDLRRRMRLGFLVGTTFSACMFLIGLYCHWRNGAL